VIGLKNISRELLLDRVTRELKRSTCHREGDAAFFAAAMMSLPSSTRMRRFSTSTWMPGNAGQRDVMVQMGWSAIVTASNRDAAERQPRDGRHPSTRVTDRAVAVGIGHPTSFDARNPR